MECQYCHVWCTSEVYRGIKGTNWIGAACKECYPTLKMDLPDDFVLKLDLTP